jgi:hypothetical protein
MGTAQLAHFRCDCHRKDRYGISSLNTVMSTQQSGSMPVEVTLVALQLCYDLSCWGYLGA